MAHGVFENIRTPGVPFLFFVSTLAYFFVLQGVAAQGWAYVDNELHRMERHPAQTVKPGFQSRREVGLGGCNRQVRSRVTLRLFFSHSSTLSSPRVTTTTAAPTGLYSSSTPIILGFVGLHFPR